MNSNGSRGYMGVTLFLAFVLLWNLLDTSAVSSYFDTIKSAAAVHHDLSIVPENRDAMREQHTSGNDYVRNMRDDQLRAHIVTEAAKRKIEPIDARIDRVWKAIPGYNGLEVDVDTTYRLARDAEGPIPWVYREVAPRVQLDDLGAQPIYKGNPHKKMVSLMINVAWGEEHLPSMLETLQEENVKATFFLDGSWLARHLDLARQIRDDGHELSNHGYSHRNMSELTRVQATAEIVKTEQLLQQLNVDNRLFAPPSGDYDDTTVQIAHEHNLRTLMWTLDTVDWKRPSAETIVQRIIPRLEGGALILMHPTEPTSEALGTLIREIKNKQYTLGTVSELLSPARIDTVEKDPLFW